MDECIIKPEKIYCYGNQYRFELTVYFMTIFSLTLKIIIYREIGAPVYGKDVIVSLNEKYKVILGKK